MSKLLNDARRAFASVRGAALLSVIGAAMALCSASPALAADFPVLPDVTTAGDGGPAGATPLPSDASAGQSTDYSAVLGQPTDGGSSQQGWAADGSGVADQTISNIASAWTSDPGQQTAIAYCVTYAVTEIVNHDSQDSQTGQQIGSGQQFDPAQAVSDLGTCLWQHAVQDPTVVVNIQNAFSSSFAP
jgi:hypothetical protein